MLKLAAGHIERYTDLLLHDMGDRLADNKPDFLATGRE
ncbi:MAG TPA: di-heme oxidoredictase family protein [Acinetobacter johnsonii]|nr:di-heme oxidoredictase family protein [Acinetobacter johnsonii]